MLPLAYTLVCVAMLIVWALRARRLRRENLVARRGWLVPLGVVILWMGLMSELGGVLIGTGVALALIGEFWPDVRLGRPRGKPTTLRAFPRWAAASEPTRPDIELHLEETGARVQNVAGTTLYLHGWSPADQNGWLQLRAVDGSGNPVQVLKTGEWARLTPWPIPNRGVRVWYARNDMPEQQWVFRADWQDVTFDRPGRELN